MNKLPNGYNTITNDLQGTLTIWDYNQNATAKLDVSLIITDLEETNMSPNPEKENDICTIFFRNYNYENKLCSLTCGHNFYFTCIVQWLCTNKSCPICRENNL